MRFNMKTGLASQKELSAPAVDFPRVNEYYTGRYLDLTVPLVKFFIIHSVSWVEFIIYCTLVDWWEWLGRGVVI